MGDEKGGARKADGKGGERNQLQETRKEEEEEEQEAYEGN